MRGFVVVVRDRTKRRGCALVESTQEAGVQDVARKGGIFHKKGTQVSTQGVQQAQVRIKQKCVQSRGLVVAQVERQAA